MLTAITIVILLILAHAVRRWLARSKRHGVPVAIAGRFGAITEQAHG